MKTKNHGRIAVMHPEKGILVVRKKGHPWNLPGGALKPKQRESFLRAGRRELHEEVGRVRITEPEWHSDHVVKKPRKRKTPEVHVVYTARLLAGHPHPHGEIGKKKWVNLKNLGRTKLAPPADIVVPMLLRKMGEGRHSTVGAQAKR